MKTIKVIFWMVFIGTISVSCTKDVFEEEPLDRFTDEAVWRDLELVNLFTNEIYNGVENWVTGGLAPSSMVDDTYSNFNWAGARTVTHGELNSDNSVNVHVNYNKGGQYPTNNNSGKWGYMYKKIRALNIFFSRIDDVPGDEAAKNQLKGEMHFLRAYFFAELVNLYGGVPLVTEVFELNSDYIVPKASYEETIAFIVKEADLAIELLPQTHDNSNTGRATKGAAMALKAQQLLYAASPLYNDGSYDLEKLELAKKANEDLFDLGQYSLYEPEEYRDIFVDYNNSEVIFAKYTPDDFIIDRENSMSRDLGMNSLHGFSAYVPLQQLVDQYEVIVDGQSVIPAHYTESGRVVTESPLYDDQNPYVNRDPRFYSNILFDGGFYRGTIEVETFVGGKDSPQAISEGWNASKSGYYIRKFTKEEVDVFSDPPTEEVMWIVYRLSEFYLNQAEILHELGEVDSFGRDATWYVNTIRSRQGVDMPTLETVNREDIRHERRIELSFEGNRYYDVRRWQTYKEALRDQHLGIKIQKLDNGSKTYEVFAVDNMVTFDPRIYYLPIPSVETNRDPNLGQSPGW